MILNRQREVRVSIPTLSRFLSRALRLMRVPASSLTVAFVSRADIARWNRSYRGKDKPTDVLSFPVEPDPAQPRTRVAADAYLGDIAIAPAVARANAVRFGRTFDAEMRILILHGILHLMGYDHETDTGQMERRESRLRRELGLA